MQANFNISDILVTKQFDFTPIIKEMVRTGEIPLVEVKWMDERVCCRYARRDNLEGASHCSELACETKTGQKWCRLNGAKRKSPCVFAEPENALIWERIREQQAIEKEIKKAKESARG